MPSHSRSAFSPLSEVRDSQSPLEALKSAGPLPALEIAAATLCAPDIEADILAIIERARREELGEPSAQLLFRGVHILGGRRLTAAYRPFVALLREADEQRLEYLLGDAITLALPKILSGLFDGDPEPLLALIADNAADPFVRNSALGAFAFLTHDRRIERTIAEAFLERFEQECSADQGEIVWYGWMSAIGLLGIERLAPQVEAAYGDGRIPDDLAGEDFFRELLAAACERPADADRFAAEDLGYINDVLETLEDYETDSDLSEWSHSIVDEPAAYQALFGPVRNPSRGVGRNDQCPCGSGKKFKKCCGA